MLKQPNFFNFIRLPFFAPDEPGAGDGDNPSEAETTKQEALNRQFQERAERAAESERKKILAELGVTDPEEAKRLIEAARVADEANRSELDKEKAARTKAEKAAEDARAEAERIAAEARTRVLNTEIKIAALAPVMDKDKKTVTRPAFKAEAIDDVLLLVSRDAIKDEEGKFSGVEEALKELAKAKPWLLAEEIADKSKGNNPRLDRQRKEKSGDGENRPRIVTSL